MAEKDEKVEGTKKDPKLALSKCGNDEELIYNDILTQFFRSQLKLKDEASSSSSSVNDGEVRKLKDVLERVALALGADASRKGLVDEGDDSESEVLVKKEKTKESHVDPLDVEVQANPKQKQVPKSQQDGADKSRESNSNCDIESGNPRVDRWYHFGPADFRNAIITTGSGTIAGVLAYIIASKMGKL